MTSDAKIDGESFGLVDLATISGVSVGTIAKWQHRGAIEFAPAGRGFVRCYTVADAIHLAIIADMRMVGLPITGVGAAFSSRLREHAVSHLAQEGTPTRLRPIALRSIDDGDRSSILEASRPDRSGSHVVLSLPYILRGILARHKATGSRRKPAQARRAAAGAGQPVSAIGP